MLRFFKESIIDAEINGKLVLKNVEIYLLSYKFVREIIKWDKMIQLVGQQYYSVTYEIGPLKI